jgi:cytochrome c biogenesis protein
LTGPGAHGAASVAASGAAALPAPFAEPSQERASDIAYIPATSRQDFIERAWRFFCSTRLMVVLMALFAVGMAAGTFLNPKDDSLAVIERSFPDRPVILWAYRAFELYAPFKSWWFTSIILALALNNLASSIERLPRIFLIVRNPERRLTDSVLRGLRNRRSTSRGGLTEETVRSGFEKAGYRTSVIQEGDTTYLFGERGAWTRFGVWVVHVALLIVCFGGIIGRLFAFEGTMEIPENGGRESAFLERMPDGTILTHPLPFQIQCDKFHLDKFKDGSARRFASDLKVLDLSGREVFSKKIIVNDPLEWDGMKFYQATYSERPDMSHANMSITETKTGQSQEVKATPQQPFSLGDPNVRFSVVNYEQEYGELGPAVQVVREQGPFAQDGTPKDPSAVTSFWVFQKYPEFDGKFRGDRWGLKFSGLEPGYTTGIQVARDPGVPWIYVGCVLLWIGLFITFWTVHRRVWARFEPDRVIFAGAAHRNKEKFRDEFDSFLGELGVSAQGRGGS